jgi:hypothetical protein
MVFKKRLLLAAAVAALPVAPLPAYAVDTAAVVSDCSTITAMPAGSTSGIYMDVTGHLCTNANGSGGGAVTVADGADTAEGHIGDSSWVSGNGTVIALLKALNGFAASSIPTTQSGVAAAVNGCDKTAFYDASTSGKTVVVAGVSAKKIYICGYIIGTGGTATNVEFGSGTGAACVTTYAKITPTWQLTANQRQGFATPFWTGLITLNNADSLCINASAANAVQAQVFYTIQP